MVDRIGSGGGSLAREAVLAALKSQAKAAEGIRSTAAELLGNETAEAESKSKTGFSDKVQEGLQAVNNEIRAAEKLPEDLLSGKISEFSEVAVQIKKAEISFNLAMEIRNKLIDSYREVMRMHV